ncbi:MAG: 2-amino-4-hydroxy-6-hydroxymethyldihydropteridine diphosphokinase [Pseudomonadales bacterium]|jgi:2-amino-4-hydroxy-6-hydroxymethyldihydropteridine diphosphokinase|nr:2-amino-4-hydroxy-6-hydroxymethyldihydropteridine diphosphokinase [Pseudomonadales bacterium]
MPRVYLGIGSNHQAQEQLAAALDALLLQFHDLALSPVFASEAEGGNGTPYLNLVAAIDTELTPGALQEWLKQLETKLGRQASTLPAGAVNIDLDLLTYGKLQGRVEGVQLPRPDFTRFAYVLWPLAILAPKEKHPQLQRTYAELWQDFAPNQAKIRPIDFIWHERRISSGAPI